VQKTAPLRMIIILN